MTSVWESFTAFNASTGKVEWRIETDGDVAVPFAAIHRRSVSNADNPDKSTEVLLVSKVAQPEAREGCTVGVVLATGNPQANDQARRIADEKARAFQCGKDQRVTIGAVPAFGRVDN
jgi:1,4-dihydroxy-2-naphthoyl-CoA synthase